MINSWRSARLLLCGMLAVLASVVSCTSVEAQTPPPRPAVEVVPSIGHSNWVNATSFSADGRLVATASDDTTIKIWERDTGRLLRSINVNARAITVALSADGRRVVSSGWGYQVRIWDVATGRIVTTLKRRPVNEDDDSDRIYSVAFSPDGRFVLTAGRDVELWDATTGQLVRLFDRGGVAFGDANYSIDGKRIIAFSRELKIWDAATGAVLRSFKVPDQEQSADYSRDGRLVLTSRKDSTELKVWNSETGQLERTLPNALPPKTGDTSYEFSTLAPDGRYVLAGRSDLPEVRIWDIRTGDQRGELKRPDPESSKSRSIKWAFSQDGRYALGEPAAAQLWDVDERRIVRTFDGQIVGLPVTISVNGGSVVLGGEGAPISVWDVTTSRLVRPFEASLTGSTERRIHKALSQDGSSLVTLDEEKGEASLWELPSGALVRSWPTARGDAKLDLFALSPNGQLVAAGGPGLELWDAATGNVVHRLLKADDGYPGKSLKFSADGRRVISAPWGEKIRVWDVRSGRQVLELGEDENVNHIATSADGRLIATGHHQCEAKLWDARTGKLLRSLNQSRDAARCSVRSVAFTPDSQWLLTGGHSEGLSSGSGQLEQSIKIWDVKTGKLARTIEGHQRGIHELAVTRDGRHIISGSFDGTVRQWDRSSGRQMAMLGMMLDGRWAIITEKGFFSATPDAGDLLSIVRGQEAVSIDQMWQSLYSPDLVREALAGDRSKEVAAAAKVVDLAKVLESAPAPTVEIASHAAGSKMTSDVVKVSARITDRGQGIGRIEWRVGGVTTAVSARPAGAGREATVSQELALDPGDNVVEVIAYNGTNLLASLPARTTITYTGPADQSRPKLHILAIGINAYVDRGWTPPGAAKRTRFPRLELAVNDTIAFADHMKAGSGRLYEDVRITFAHDTDATRPKLDALVDRLARDIHPRDTFVLFVAAHGKSENGRFYIVPQDFQSGPGMLEQMAIGQDLLQDWLANRIKARRALILLDTCESGALVAGYSRTRTDDAASDAAVGRLHEATGRPVLTAAASGKPALEGFENHGVFTWALLDALRRGDTNGNGTIELSELVAHVQHVVPKISADLQGIGRAAIATTRSSSPVAAPQSARFGSRGEDFSLVGRLP